MDNPETQATLGTQDSTKTHKAKTTTQKMNDTDPTQ